jgi:hypothetical protein
MSMPACFAALRMVLPAGALTFWPFMLILTIVIVCHASFLDKIIFILTLASISNVADTVPRHQKSLILQFDHQIKLTLRGTMPIEEYVRLDICHARLSERGFCVKEKIDRISVYTQTWFRLIIVPNEEVHDHYGENGQNKGYGRLKESI